MEDQSKQNEPLIESASTDSSAVPPIPPVQPGQPTPYQQQPSVGYQPPTPGQPSMPYAQQPAYYQPMQSQSSGKATGALVCGILAILLAWAPLFGIILGVVAIVLASKAIKEAGKNGLAPQVTGAKKPSIACALAPAIDGSRHLGI